MVHRLALQTQSLFDLCIRKISHEYYVYLESLDFLPLGAKEKILDILCKRGKADIKSISELANHQVKKLDLYGNDVTDDVLRCTSVCTNLRSLSIAGIRRQSIPITDYGLLDSLPNFKQLRVVQISNCPLITNTSIICLSDNCRHLQTVNLTSCSQLNDEALISLCKKCHFISALTMARTKISDEGIRYLTQSPCNAILRELQLDGCNYITDAAIEYLSINCRNLAILTFSCCNGVTDTSRCYLATMMERQGCKMKQMFWSISA